MFCGFIITTIHTNEVENQVNRRHARKFSAVSPFHSLHSFTMLDGFLKIYILKQNLNRGGEWKCFTAKEINIIF